MSSAAIASGTAQVQAAPLALLDAAFAAHRAPAENAAIAASEARRAAFLARPATWFHFASECDGYNPDTGKRCFCPICERREDAAIEHEADRDRD